MVSRFLLLAILVCGCNSKTDLTPGEYISFMENEKNDFRSTITSGKIRYTFQYKPAEYIAFKESGQSEFNNEKFAKRIDDLAYTAWFNVYIEMEESEVNPIKNQVNSLDEYNQRVVYFLDRAKNSFSLLYGGEEMPLAGYHFENNYGLTPADVIVIGFKIPDSKPEKEIVLEYSDRLFGNELMKNRVSKKQLSNIPSVIF